MSLQDVLRLLDLPDDSRVEALLSPPESQWLERKSSRVAARDLAEVIAALANAEGGVIIIGLHDKGVEGVQRAREADRSAWRQAGVDHLIPVPRTVVHTVRCTRADGTPDELMVIEVPPSDRVHATTRDDVWLRVGDECRRLGFQERLELQYEKGQVTFETAPVPEAGPDTLVPALLHRYAQAIGASDAYRALHARNLVDLTGSPLAACVLLFGETPQRWFPQAVVRVLRFAGTERGTGARQRLLADHRYDGAIPRQIEGAAAKVADLLPTRRALGRRGTFEQVPLIPGDAWLEGIVNAVVHRSYSVTGDHVRIEIFDDRIEIESPGRFPGLVDPSDPRNVSRFARNPRISRACAELHFGQELGEGMRRICDELDQAGLVAPKWYQTVGSVRLVLESTAAATRDEALRPAVRALLELVRRDGPVGTGDLVRASGQSRPTVLRHLKALSDGGWVQRSGGGSTDPGAVWSARGVRR